MSIAESNTDIANMAISNLGSGKEIDSLDTERSQEASACRRYYDSALRATLRDKDWGFNRKVVTLTLVEDFRPVVYPNEWQFSYQWPANALIVRKLLSGNRIDTLNTKVPWEKRWGQNGPLIYTDMETPSAKIGVLVEAVELYPPDFVLAFSMLLSSLVAPRLTNGDPLSLGAKSYQKYLILMSSAEKNDAIEDSPDVLPDSDMINGRD